MARLFLIENKFTPVTCDRIGLGKDIRIALEEIALRKDWHEITREIYGVDVSDPWGGMIRRTAFNVSVQIGTVNISSTAQEMYNICETIKNFMDVRIHNGH